ncbi:flagellin [Neptuniibacter caesariensis]|uniref:Flagellin n=1 Tax=Neptuniibacter caesariensis TaxID=207954 RepID=A0A7U8GRE8_NEPCE|nr:flagellin [Neptuniibacter caesariensis]EAR60085.1 flagellin FliC [Oceanospirillum sp. MED92] [Neptuniibacter caesariensis]
MAMVINSNIMSLNAQRNLMISQGDQNQAMERLTSGKRINSAADDAAGLAISNRMTSQVRGLDQAIRNANDGISLIQTAEGALDETTNILQRMRELSIQSANGTYDEGNRGTLNAEVQQLVAEIDRISETTKFNGLNILDGTLGNVDLQAGADANETIALEIGALDSRSIGGSGGTIIGEAVTAIGVLETITGATGTGALTINDQAISSLTGEAILQDQLDSINADINDYGAEVSTLVEWESAGVGDGVLVAGTDEVTITVTNNFEDATSFVITDTQNMDDLVSKINDVAGGTVQASVNQDGKLILRAENAGSIAVADTAGRVDEAFGLSAGTTTDTQFFSLVVNDTSADQSGVKIEQAGTGASAAYDIADNIGIDLSDDNGNLLSQSLSGTADLSGTTVQAGDLIINGVEIGEITGGTTEALTVDAAVEAINKMSDQTGVVAFESDTSGAGGVSGIGLRSASGDEIAIEYASDLNSTQETAILNLTGLQERNASEGAGSVASIDISTAAGAQKAIGIIDSALEEINATRGDLGAINNRLDFTINNLSNVSENVAAARSRIEDADFAAESAALSRAQVLQQAGTAMLAQANAAPQQVLSLLQ